MDLGGGYAEVFQRYQNIRLLISRLTGGTIYDRNICSTASVSAMVIKRLCPAALRQFDDSIDPILRECFFGGRKQHSSELDAEMWYFDYSNMYGNLLRLDYPLKCKLEPFNLDFSLPGFYEIIFEYSGPLSCVKLPTRRLGSTVYEPCGRGWYWHEEIEEFRLCGGSVYYCGGSIIAYHNFPHLKQAADFLINQRRLGLESAKVVLNGMYGRLAIKPTSRVTRVERCGNDLSELYSYKRYVRHKNFIMYETDSKSAGKNVRGNISWACIVSSRGRAQIMRLMFECEILGFKPAYVNTDCVYIKSECKPVIDSSRLMQEVIFARRRVTAGCNGVV